MSAQSEVPASRRLLWIGAAVLVLAQLVVRGYVLARGGFYWDDVAFIGRASRSLIDPGAWFVDYDGHFMPAALWLGAALTKLAPLSWPAAAASVLVLQALASVATVRALIVVAGRRVGVLVPLAFALFTPLILTATAWWASALNALPLQIGLAVVVAETVRYLRGNRRSAWYAVAALVIALLFFEKALVVPFVAVATAVLLAYVRGGTVGGAVRTVLRCGRPLWATYAVLVAAWLVLWTTVTASRPGEHTVAFTLRALWRSVTEVLAPAALGGPWSWTRENPGPPLAVTGWPVTVVGLLAIAAVLALTWRYAPRGLAAWGCAAFYFAAASGAVFFLRSSEYTSALLPLSLRYFADSGWVIALAGAVVVAAPRRSERRGVRVRPGVWLSLALVLAVSGSVSAVRFAPVWRDNPTGAYLQTLRETSAEYADREVLDQEVDTDVISRLAAPNNRLSRVLATQPDPPRFAEHAAEATVVDETGRFQPGTVTRVRSLPLGPFPCGTRVDAAPVTLAYEGPLAYWEWVVQLNYLASADGVVTISQQRGATPVDVPVRKGAHTVYVRVSGTGDGLVAQARTPDLVACVGSGPVGLLVPTARVSGPR